MTIRCIAVDDEPMALEKLKNYIEKIPFLELAATCEGAYEAMQVMAERKIDAVFIDINMPDINGMDFIASLEERPLVVFTTAYAEYAVESYKVVAADYLLKPFGFADFQRAANRLLRQFTLFNSEKATAANTDSLYIKVDYKYVRVALADIRYIEGMNEYLKLHLAGGRKPLVTHTTMRQILENLPANFLQVHRSYIVNMEQVMEVERARIVMDKETRIPVGDSYREAFMHYLHDRALGTDGKKPAKSSSEAGSGPGSSSAPGSNSGEE